MVLFVVICQIILVLIARKFSIAKEAEEKTDLPCKKTSNGEAFISAPRPYVCTPILSVQCR